MQQLGHLKNTTGMRWSVENMTYRTVNALLTRHFPRALVGILQNAEMFVNFYSLIAWSGEYALVA